MLMTMRPMTWQSFKASETLLGIETFGYTNAIGRRDSSFKASETLLGIETRDGSLLGDQKGNSRLQSLWNPFRDWNNSYLKIVLQLPKLQSLWNPFRDWNLCAQDQPVRRNYSFKASETLLGIETLIIFAAVSEPRRFKASETLLGIETYGARSLWSHGCRELQSLWNPFRDWNITMDFSVDTSKLLQSLWNPFRDWNYKTHFPEVEIYRLQSLWNPFRDWNLFLSLQHWFLCMGFKASETLLGIETNWLKKWLFKRIGFKASETLLGIETEMKFFLIISKIRRASKPLKPF